MKAQKRTHSVSGKMREIGSKSFQSRGVRQSSSNESTKKDTSGVGQDEGDWKQKLSISRGAPEQLQ